MDVFSGWVLLVDFEFGIIGCYIVCFVALFLF